MLAKNEVGMRSGQSKYIGNNVYMTENENKQRKT